MQALSVDEARSLVEEGIIRIKWAVDSTYEVYTFEPSEYNDRKAELMPTYLVLEVAESEALMSIQTQDMPEHRFFYLSSKSWNPGGIMFWIIASCARFNLEPMELIPKLLGTGQGFIHRHASRWT